MTSYHFVTIGSTIEKLTKALGQPIYLDLEADNEKVQAEWEIQLNGKPHYIYSWKEYRTLTETEFISFHVGSYDFNSSIDVKNHVKNLLSNL